MVQDKIPVCNVHFRRKLNLMNYHPNFPPSLSISPTVLQEHITTSNAFGIAAQRDAIEKYGIAGRVW